MADPVTDQPTVSQERPEETSEEAEGAGGESGLVQSTSWWGVSSLSSYLTSPHLLEQGINNMASTVAQVRISHCESQIINVTHNRDLTMSLPSLYRFVTCC